MEELLQNIGFDQVREIPTDIITFEPSLTLLCQQNVCGSYCRNYTCPPLVGKAEELIEKTKSFKKAIVFQKIYSLDDSYDYEGMMHGKAEFGVLIEKVQKLCKEHLSHCLLLGAGGCEICETCGAVDDTPCRFPDRATASLESYCIQVSALASQCGMKYVNGRNTVTYFGAVFYN